NNNYLNLHNENMFKVGFDSDESPRVASDVISRRTASNSANVFITESGTLGRSSCSERYKVNIEKEFDDRKAKVEQSKKIIKLNNNDFNLHNENLFKVGFDSDGSPRVASDVISRRTASNSANVFITESGTLGRSSSSERYKVNIEKQFDDRNAQLEHSKKILN